MLAAASADPLAKKTNTLHIYIKHKCYNQRTRKLNI